MRTSDRPKKNEGKACDAVLRMLERRTGCMRANLRYPERDRSGPPVELLVQLGDQRYALEHTQIEAFPDQLYMGVRFTDLFDHVVTALSGSLPVPGIYHLNFPIDAGVGVNQDQLIPVSRALRAWVLRMADDLHREYPRRLTKSERPRGYFGQRRGVPAGVPFEVTLTRSVHWAESTRHDGVLLGARFAPTDVESLRRARIVAALNKKCPKLLQCKSTGARSILILEDTDIALSNHIVIGEALGDALIERVDHPDEIYLVSTIIDPWTVRTLKRENLLWPDENYEEFQSVELTDLTANSTASA